MEDRNCNRAPTRSNERLSGDQTTQKGQEEGTGSLVAAAWAISCEGRKRKTDSGHVINQKNCHFACTECNALVS